jgi:ACR3 family arsenite efflux pump ArsB
MITLTTSDLFSINRNSIAGVSIAVLLYSYASKYETDSRKASIIKDVAIILMIYTLICIILFNGISIMSSNTDFIIILYAVLTIIMLSISIFMIYTNLN